MNQKIRLTKTKFRAANNRAFSKWCSRSSGTSSNTATSNAGISQSAGCFSLLSQSGLFKLNIRLRRWAIFASRLKSSGPLKAVSHGQSAVIISLMAFCQLEFSPLSFQHVDKGYLASWQARTRSSHQTDQNTKPFMPRN